MHVTPLKFFSRILGSLQFIIFFSEQSFFGNYSAFDSHTNTVISHMVAYPSRWLPKLWQGLLHGGVLERQWEVQVWSRVVIDAVPHPNKAQVSCQVLRLVMIYKKRVTLPWVKNHDIANFQISLFDIGYKNTLWKETKSITLIRHLTHPPHGKPTLHILHFLMQDIINNYRLPILKLRSGLRSEVQVLARDHKPVINFQVTLLCDTLWCIHT